MLGSNLFLFKFELVIFYGFDPMGFITIFHHHLENSLPETNSNFTPENRPKSTPKGLKFIIFHSPKELSSSSNHPKELHHLPTIHSKGTTMFGLFILEDVFQRPSLSQIRLQNLQVMKLRRLASLNSWVLCGVARYHIVFVSNLVDTWHEGKQGIQ